jgi:hypothetical protein
VWNTFFVVSKQWALCVWLLTAHAVLTVQPLLVACSHAAALCASAATCPHGQERATFSAVRPQRTVHAVDCGFIQLAADHVLGGMCIHTYLQQS